MANEPFGTGDADDATPGRPVPDPLDRIWRHPSEMPVARPAPRVRDHRRSRRRASTAIGFAVVAAAVGGSLLTVVVLAVAGAFDDATPRLAATNQLLSTAATAPITAAAAGVRPAIVSVVVHDHGTVRRGAAVCIRQGTELLTVAALVGNARTVELVTPAGAQVVGRVVGRDPSSGLALLAADVDVPAARLATHASTPGDPVLAVGARGWISIGTVNSVQLVLAVHDGVMMRGLTATSLDEGIDATGAALVDRNGAVVGIQLGDHHAAVPIEYARQAAEELRTRGWVRHGWVGITGHDQSGAVVIETVTPGSPAATAGLRAGDHVVSIDGDPIDMMSDVTAEVRTAWPGDTLTFSVVRSAGPTDVAVHVGEPHAATTGGPAAVAAMAHS